jgi:hypothetical protein
MNAFAKLRGLGLAATIFLLACASTFPPGARAADPAADLINAYYVELLLRTPSSDEVAYWTSEVERLSAAGVSKTEAFRAIAFTFLQSPAYDERRGRGPFSGATGWIGGWYRGLYGRDPDPVGASYWLFQLEIYPASLPLFSRFVFSPEFDAHVESTVGVSPPGRPEVLMVVDFYRGFLYRLPDDDGLAYWVGRLRRAQCEQYVGAEVDAMTRAFLDSPEFANLVLAHLDYEYRQLWSDSYGGGLYNALLRAGPDYDGYEYWVGGLMTNRLSPEFVRRQFVASPRFQASVAAVRDAGCILPAPPP